MATSAPAPDADENAQGAHLAALNSTALGTLMPTVTLPNGQKVQTGTIGALIVHIKEYDQIMASTPVNVSRKRELEGAIAAALPVLKKADIFYLFKPEEWMAGSSPGRHLVGQLAQQAEDLKNFL